MTATEEARKAIEWLDRIDSTGLGLSGAETAARDALISLLSRLEAAEKVIGDALDHCKRGHEFTPENTYYPKRGGRVCRACNSRAVTCPQCGNQVSRPNLAAHTRRNHGKERS